MRICIHAAHHSSVSASYSWTFFSPLKVISKIRMSWKVSSSSSSYYSYHAHTLPAPRRKYHKDEYNRFLFFLPKVLQDSLACTVKCFMNISLEFCKEQKSFYKIKQAVEHTKSKYGYDGWQAKKWLHKNKLFFAQSLKMRNASL